MHRDPYTSGGVPRIEPSERAKAARDKWIADNGGEEAIKRRIAGGTIPGTGELDYLVLRWHQAMMTKGADRLRSAIAAERMAQQRRAWRLMWLAIALAYLAIGGTLALVAWYGVLGHH